MKIVRDVSAFHKAGEVPFPPAPGFPAEDRVALRKKLIEEEVGETLQAIDSRDLVEVADGIADSIVVLVGTALEFGIDLGAVWDEVQRSNMSKFPSCTACEGAGCEACNGRGTQLIRREDGKILKPESWSPPDIPAALGVQNSESEGTTNPGDRMHTAVFVVGPPGVGKTSAVREVLGEGYVNFTHPETSKVKWCLNAPWAFAGHYGMGTFDGADTVPNDGWIPCMEWWEKEILSRPELYSYTLFDGDRFSHANCQKFLEDRGVRVLCVHLTASDEVMDARRKERGSDQNPTWLKGRVSKARNFAERFKPKETALFDMFGGGADEADSENRLTEIVVENITPEGVAARIRAAIEG